MSFAEMCVAAVVLFASAHAESSEIIVGENDVRERNVPGGSSETQEDRLVTGPGGMILKTGTGDWNVPAGVRRGYHPLVLSGIEGKILFTEGGQVPANGCPAVVREKAAMWLDSTKTASMTLRTDGGIDYVDAWYDARETDKSAPSHLYATANNGGTRTNYGTPWTYSALSPELKTAADGTTAVYFGGWKSARSMTWRQPSGTLYPSAPASGKVRHVFLVLGEWSFHGTPVGYIDSETTSAGTHGDPLLVPSAYGSSGATAPWGCYSAETYSLASVVRNSRLFENGRAIDPMVTKPAQGFKVVDFAPCNEAFAANTFFNERNYIGESCPAWGGCRGGGEYIAEAIVFTNILREAERLEVEAYLMNRWIRDPEPGTTVALGAAAELEVSDVADIRSVSGNGRVMLSGGGDVTVDSKDKDLPDVALDIGTRAVTLTKTLQVSADAGTAIDAEATAIGPKISMDAAAEGALVKTGAGDVALAVLPSGVRKLEVGGGRLTIRAKKPDAAPAFAPEPVAIGNPSFEEGFDAYKTDGVRAYNNQWNDFGGWTFKGSSGFAYYYPSGVRSGSSGWMCNAPPADGDWYLVLKQGDSVWTKVELAKDGVYELSFWAAARSSQTAGHQLDVMLVSEDGSVTNRFGKHIVINVHDFTEAKYRTEATAGKWTLLFAQPCNYDLCTFIDDVRLSRVSETFAEGWRIPGGDFEQASFADQAAVSAFAAGGAAGGWTLGGGAGFVTALYSSGKYYNNRRVAHGGSVQVAMTDANSTATTVFRPPAGTWRLAAAYDFAVSSNSTLTASIAVGDGEAVGLGGVGVNSHLMEDVVWPATFTVDGTEDVTLTLAFDNSSATTAVGVLDDVRLVPVKVDTETELLSDGGFESWFTYGSDPAIAWSGVRDTTVCEFAAAERLAYASQQGHFGYSRYEGDYRLQLTQNAAAYRKIVFPQKGRYRLSFWVSHRCEPDYPDWTGWGDNPVRAWITQGGAQTNQIAYVDTFGTNYVQHVFDFEVPESGAWFLGFQGCTETPRGGRTSYVDGASVKAVDCAGETVPEFDPELEVSVAAGARLDLPFADSRTNIVREVRLGGRRRHGVINAKTDPEYISGGCTFFVEPVGCVIIFR